MDVVVTDKKGHPVPGLTRDDLVVTEDGVPQKIVSFDAVALPDAPSAKAAPASHRLHEHRPPASSASAPS